MRSIFTSRGATLAAVAFLIAPLLFAPHSSVAITMQKPAQELRQTLTVNTTTGRVVVTLNFKNSGKRVLYIPKEIAIGKSLTSAAFEIWAEGAVVVDYVGMMVKRGPLTAEDYFPLAPHSNHNNQIDITDAYDFKTGKHSYRIFAPIDYLADINQLEEVMPVPGSIQIFSFRR